eukprot:1194788-Prorocentrum_minimum.AAC.4
MIIIATVSSALRDTQRDTRAITKPWLLLPATCNQTTLSLFRRRGMFHKLTNGTSPQEEYSTT